MNEKKENESIRVEIVLLFLVGNGIFLGYPRGGPDCL